MRVLIDADGCPVVNETISVSRRAGAECLILCDTAHHFEREGARTLTVSKGADSVDFALVNLVQAGDVVVTQDYGLAAMCLAPVSYTHLDVYKRQDSFHSYRFSPLPLQIEP